MTRFLVCLGVLCVFAPGASAQKVNAFPEKILSRVTDYDLNEANLLGQQPHEISSEESGAAHRSMRNLEAGTVLLNSEANCSGVLVSDEGHVLTALHCLDLRQHARPTPLETAEVALRSGTRIGVVRPIANWDETYSLRSLPLGDQEAELVFLGKGYPARFTQLSETERSEGRSFFEDFAVIKLKQVPAGHRCVATSSNTPGGTVWHTGYPLMRSKQVADIKALSRLKSRVQDNEELSSAIDAVMDKLSDETLNKKSWALALQYPFALAIGRSFPSYETARTSFPHFSTPKNLALLDSFSDPMVYAVSTAPVIGGFSGGGVFSTAGELVGINSLAPGNGIGMGDFYYGVSWVKLGHIQKRIKAAIGTLAHDRIFDCK